MAARDKAFGAVMCILALIIGIIYFYALLGPGGYALLAIELVVSTMVIVVLAIMFWIGYTIASTPSIEEIEKAAKKK